MVPVACSNYSPPAADPRMPLKPEARQPSRLPVRLLVSGAMHALLLKETLSFVDYAWFHKARATNHADIAAFLWHFISNSSGKDLELKAVNHIFSLGIHSHYSSIVSVQLESKISVSLNTKHLKLNRHFWEDFPLIFFSPFSPQSCVRAAKLWAKLS